MGKKIRSYLRPSDGRCLKIRSIILSATWKNSICNMRKTLSAPRNNNNCNMLKCTKILLNHPTRSAKTRRNMCVYASCCLLQSILSYKIICCIKTFQTNDCNMWKYLVQHTETSQKKNNLTLEYLIKYSELHHYCSFMKNYDENKLKHLQRLESSSKT